MYVYVVIIRLCNSIFTIIEESLFCNHTISSNPIERQTVTGGVLVSPNPAHCGGDSVCVLPGCCTIVSSNELAFAIPEKGGGIWCVCVCVPCGYVCVCVYEIRASEVKAQKCRN